MNECRNECAFTGECRGGASAQSDDHPAGHVVIHRLVPHLNKQNEHEHKTNPEASPARKKKTHTERQRKLPKQKDTTQKQDKKSKPHRQQQINKKICNTST